MGDLPYIHRTDTVYTTLRIEIADALINRNRGDLAARINALDDDALHECEKLMVDHAERLLDSLNRGVVPIHGVPGDGCSYCGEAFADNDARAEIYHPIHDNGSIVVHAEPCGTYLLRNGWEIA